MFTVTISPSMYEGKYYFTVEQFSALTKLSPKTIYQLVREGNQFRKLKTAVFDKKIRVLASEFTDYPFMGDGRFPLKKCYKFVGPGEKRELSEQEATREMAQ